MSKLVLVVNKEGKVIGNVDEHTGLARIRRECPAFFGSSLGRRETYSIHRGQLIVRSTVQFTELKPERKTVVYLYFVDGELADDTFFVASGRMTPAHARKLIDRVLDGGKCWFGMDEETP